MAFIQQGHLDHLLSQHKRLAAKTLNMITRARGLTQYESAALIFGQLKEIDGYVVQLGKAKSADKDVDASNLQSILQRSDQIARRELKRSRIALRVSSNHRTPHKRIKQEVQRASLLLGLANAKRLGTSKDAHQLSEQNHHDFIRYHLLHYMSQNGLGGPQAEVREEAAALQEKTDASAAKLLVSGYGPVFRAKGQPRKSIPLPKMLQKIRALPGLKDSLLNEKFFDQYRPKLSPRMAPRPTPQ